MLSGSWIDAPEAAAPSSAEALAAQVAHRSVRAVCGGARLYPGNIDKAVRSPSLRQALSDSVRDALSSVGDNEPPLVLDGGFALLRRLEGIAELGSRVVGDVDSEGRSTPPSSSARQAAELAAETRAPHALSSGDLLVSHPLLRRDVVLLLSAYDGWEGFCMGLVLNDPTAARVGATPLLAGRGQSVGPARSGGASGGASGSEGGTGAAAKTATAAEVDAGRGSSNRSVGAGRGGGESVDIGGEDRVRRSEWTTGGRQLTDAFAALRRTRIRDLDVFAEHVIHHGGPDGGANVTMLHTYPAVRGCVRIAGWGDLCYGGDLGHAAQLVRDGHADKRCFRFYKGRVDFRPGELKGEVEMGEWRVLAAATTQAAAGVRRTQVATVAPPRGRRPTTVFAADGAGRRRGGRRRGGGVRLAEQGVAPASGRMGWARSTARRRRGGVTLFLPVSSHHLPVV